MGDLHAISSTPAKPGLHSYNLNRLANPREPRLKFVGYIRTFLLLCGLGGLGYYGYTLADGHIYQAYENWSFDRHISGQPGSFTDWLRERTPLGSFMNPATKTTTVTPPKPAVPTEPVRPIPVEGSLLGRIEIDRLHLKAIVREGVGDQTLARAVGHVPSTALPGQAGNFAIAAHRDTLFRALKDIKKDDRVTFRSGDGTYTYQVVSTQIVKPTDISVLRPQGSEKLLTMITCYPFYYVGSAPNRFIVQGKLVSTDAGSVVKDGADVAHLSPGPAALRKNESPPKPISAKSQAAKQASVRGPRHPRGSSHFTKASRSSVRNASSIPNETDNSGIKTRRKHGFWYRVFHRDGA